MFYLPFILPLAENTFPLRDLCFSAFCFLEKHHANTPSIGHILEMPDLQVDALCTDQDGYLSFLSVWGRDTATQELLARLTLPANETASLIQGFNLRLDNKSSTSTNKILVIPDLLEKTFSRTFGRTKFGSIRQSLAV